MKAEKYNQLSKRYREAIVSRLWDQWTSIGAGGYSTKAQLVTWCVDPEVLILASSRLFQCEPRLRDSALEWIFAFPDLVSITRMKRLQDEFSIGDAEEMAGIASIILTTNPSLRSWQSIEKWNKNSMVKEAAVFQKRGLASARVFTGVAQTILKFRALFGVTSRVEILIWLYQRGVCDIGEIAAETVWFRKTVQKTLSDMALSGLVQEAESTDRRKEYFMTSHPWAELFPDGFSKEHRVSQHFLYPGVFKIMEALDRCVGESISENIKRLLLSEALSECFWNHQRARSSELRPENAEEYLSEALELLVSDAESGEEWPAGSFEVNPSQVRFESAT